MADTSTGESRFSITQGPFLRVLQRLHLTRDDGMPRAAVLVVVAWVPMVVGGLLRVAVRGHSEPLLRDLSAHARLLVGIPLLVEAERILERRCRETVDLLYRGAFAPIERLDPIVTRVVQLREARGVELLLVALAVLGGQAVLWGVAAPTRLFGGFAESGGVSFARLWYAMVSLPITQFLLLRWLWHWALWTYVLVRLSRLPLKTIATHPDQAAGLGFLSLPVQGYYAFALAVSTTLASSWGTEILVGHASLSSFTTSFVIVLVAAIILGCGPLLAFTTMLYRARWREIERYDELALEYVREFHAKWIEAQPVDEQLLGTPDIQSLSDLVNAHAHLARARLVVFETRQLVGIAIAAALPMLPLIATAVPLATLLKRIGGALLGGLPA